MDRKKKQKEKKKKGEQGSKIQRQKSSKIKMNCLFFQVTEISFDSKTDHPFYLV